MISSINYRGLIKLVLHYRANNSFRPSPPANSDTQITIHETRFFYHLSTKSFDRWKKGVRSNSAN